MRTALRRFQIGCGLGLKRIDFCNLLLVVVELLGNFLV